MRTHGIAWIMGMGLLGLPLFVAAEQVPPTAGQPTVLTSALGQPTSAGSSLPRMEQLAAVYCTPKAIAGFLREEFIFRRDEELFNEVDRWQAPEEFLKRRVGDCEDYALLATELLRRNGLEAYVFSLFGEDGYAHTVSVFVDEQGRYNVINQEKLRQYRTKSLEALASALNPSWTFGGIVEQAGTRGRMVREITNEHPALGWNELANF